MVFGAPEKGSRDHVTSGDLKSPAGVKILPQHTLDWRPLHATNCHQNSKWRCETLARHWLVFEYVNGILNPIMNQGIMPCTDHLAGYQVFLPSFLIFFFFSLYKNTESSESVLVIHWYDEHSFNGRSSHFLEMTIHTLKILIMDIYGLCLVFSPIQSTCF